MKKMRMVLLTALGVGGATVIGALLGLPLGNALLAYVIAQIKIDMVSFDTIISTASYLFSIILTFAFTALVSILLYFKLQKINMAESLKSIELTETMMQIFI